MTIRAARKEIKPGKKYQSNRQFVYEIVIFSEPSGELHMRTPRIHDKRLPIVISQKERFSIVRIGDMGVSQVSGYEAEKFPKRKGKLIVKNHYNLLAIIIQFFVSPCPRRLQSSAYLILWNKSDTKKFVGFFSFGIGWEQYSERVFEWLATFHLKPKKFFGCCQSCCSWRAAPRVGGSSSGHGGQECVMYWGRSGSFIVHGRCTWLLFDKRTQWTWWLSYYITY